MSDREHAIIQLYCAHQLFEQWWRNLCPSSLNPPSSKSHRPAFFAIPTSSLEARVRGPSNAISDILDNKPVQCSPWFEEKEGHGRNVESRDL